MELFLETIFGAIVPVCVTCMVTLAITLIFKTSFTTNFAQGLISAFGAYVASELIFSKTEMSIWAAVPIGVVVSTVIAVAIDVLIFRRGRYVNALGKQIITMGLISVIVGVIPMIFKTQKPQFSTFIDSGFLQLFNLEKASFTVDFNGDGIGAVVQYNQLFCLILTVIVIATIFILLRYSKWGLSVRATASNEYVAGMMGINTHIVTAVSWGLAGGLGALAACMNASNAASINTYFMTNYQVYAFLAGILGGFATFHGPVIAAAMIPLANSLVIFIGAITGKPLSTWSQVIVYGIALVIIFFKPSGLFGKKQVKKV